MAPVVEELLFRGAIQGHLLRKWKKPLWAIVVSSLIFGIVHGNWVQAPFAFVVGLALGWIYYHSENFLHVIGQVGQLVQVIAPQSHTYN